MADTRPVPLRALQSIPRELIKRVGRYGKEAGSLYPQNYLDQDGVREMLQRVPFPIELLSSAVHGYTGSTPQTLSELTRMDFDIALSAIAAWRRSQYIFELNEEFEQELPLSGFTIPSHAIKNLPAPSVWIALSSGLGCLVSLNLCGSIVSMVFFDEFYGDLIARPTALRLNTELSEAAEWAILFPEKHLSSWLASYVGVEAICRLASAALYLCSEQPDIVEANSSAANKRRIKEGKAPLHPQIHHVGVRYGAAFRKAREERKLSESVGSRGRGPAPHVRRAHWHTYWVGAKGTAERRRVIKWLPPIPVNLSSYDDLIPTARKLEESE